MRAVVLVALALVAGCGSSGTQSPASETADGGDSSVDASPSGGDAGPPKILAACNDAVSDAYVVPTNLPAMTDAARGDVVRCAADTSIDASQMQSRLSAANVAGVDVKSGAVTYRIAYRTTRGDGSAGVSSARVYVPTAPRGAKLPVVVAAHGTAGLADACAPTKYESISDYLVLPWVAHGYAVIAPDDAGLGNAAGGRVQGYGDNVDTGRSTLDAARALRKLVDADALTNKVIVYGHSQGGGSALSAQALASSYGAGGDLAAVIGFAAGWTVSASVDGFRYPSIATSFGGGGPATFGALFVYSYFANHVGPTHAGDGFGANVRSNVDALITSQCIFQLISTIPQAAPTVGDLFDGTFMSTTVACGDGTSGCAEPGKSYVSFLKSNVLKGDANGAKVLLVQGLNDTTVPASSEQCIVQKLTADGVSPQLCTDASGQHLDVVQRNAAFALSWTDAVVDGTAPPTCSGAGMPACQ